MNQALERLASRIKEEHKAAQAALASNSDTVAIYRAQGRLRLAEELLKSIEPDERRQSNKSFT